MILKTDFGLEDVESALIEARNRHRAGRAAEAAPVYARILELNPDHPEANSLMGIIRLQKGDAIGAAQQFQRAIALDAANPSYHLNLGGAYFQQGRLADAEAAFQEAVKLDPSLADGFHNLGSLHLLQNRVTEAMEDCRSALAINPDHVPARSNLGAALSRADRIDEAMEEYKAVLTRDPNFADTLRNLGILYKQRGRVLEAQSCFARLKTPGGYVNRLTTLPAIPRTGGEIEGIRRSYHDGLERLLSENIRLDDPLLDVGSSSQFYLAYHGENDRPLQEMLARFYRRAAPSLTYVAAHCRSLAQWRPGRRLKVGFVSRHFYNHTIGKLVVGLVAALPRDTLEVHVFTLPRAGDHLSQLIFSRADRAQALPPNLDAARRAISDQQLDVLVYTDIGMEPFTYFLAFARLAPVQLVTWGHPATTGIDTLDGFVSSVHLEDEGAESHYSEKLLRLEHPPTYYYRPTPSGRLKGRDHFGLSENARIYLCPQSLFKFHPVFDVTMGEILRRDPKGEIVLVDGLDPVWAQTLKERWSAPLADVADRIRVLPRMGQDDFFSLLSLADVMLDIPQFSGGNTSLEGFGMNAPIVTQPSPYMRGRPTYAFYKKMGIDAPIASSDADYVEKALSLAQDSASLRAEIAARSDQLYEDPAVPQSFARLLIQTVEEARGA